MRIFCVSVLLLLISVSCSLVDTDSEIIYMGTPENALQTIRAQAKKHYDIGDQWQKPTTTHQTMEGDCDDWAGLFTSAIIAYGETATIVAGYYDGKFGHAWHMAVKYKGRFISPQWYEPYMTDKEFTVWIEYSFEDYLRLCVK